MPQLLIAPFKEEDEWDSPHIVRYYDVMSDEEIERIKEIAKPKVGVSGPAGALNGVGAVPPAASVGQAACAPKASVSTSSSACCGPGLML